MLVLTRRVGESILVFPSDDIDPDTPVGELFGKGPIRITLTRVSGNQARLGIVAPDTLAIAREEVA